MFAFWNVTVNTFNRISVLLCFVTWGNPGSNLFFFLTQLLDVQLCVQSTSLLGFEVHGNGKGHFSELCGSEWKTILIRRVMLMGQRSSLACLSQAKVWLKVFCTLRTVLLLVMCSEQDGNITKHLFSNSLVIESSVENRHLTNCEHVTLP